MGACGASCAAMTCNGVSRQTWCCEFTGILLPNIKRCDARKSPRSTESRTVGPSLSPSLPQAVSLGVVRLHAVDDDERLKGFLRWSRGVNNDEVPVVLAEVGHVVVAVAVDANPEASFNFVPKGPGPRPGPPPPPRNVEPGIIKAFTQARRPPVRRTSGPQPSSSAAVTVSASLRSSMPVNRLIIASLLVKSTSTLVARSNDTARPSTGTPSS
mmetsp:Transcript_87242/g.244846  ORF Transcript_87242/g.244846 Transcript_87242/m.244846 type:complete len:213 (+) Transcript_87242:690-1328(+)